MLAFLSCLPCLVEIIFVYYVDCVEGAYSKFPRRRAGNRTSSEKALRFTIKCGGMNSSSEFLFSGTRSSALHSNAASSAMHSLASALNSFGTVIGLDRGGADADMLSQQNEP